MIDWEKLIDEYNDMRYFTTDPVAVVKRCTEQKDVEVMGIVCSWLAYGNRNQIYKKCCMAYDLMGGMPYEYVMSCRWREYKGSRENFYRLFYYSDFYDLMQSLYNVYQQHVTLEDAVIYTLYSFPVLGGVHEVGGGSSLSKSYDKREQRSLLQLPSIARINNEVVTSAKRETNEFDLSCRVKQKSTTQLSTLNSLISLLQANGIPQNTKSACKRLCLFLRWMVRRDGIVDLGVWHKFSPADLLIPLDVHVNRVARQHGLLTRISADMRAVEELTANCRKLYPHDPAIMDFALFGAGYTSK